jgi:AP-3 complex subunit delta-1
MFEKSLVDLIRGLRSHKGDEPEYIQSALKECRSEIRSQDMDIKATALLKLIYLEMFGYDMTWAAFNVLEVMSSAKHAQKRVGYLGAVQSIRPDTDVLMLATNLLKKDLTSPLIPIMSLPLITLPHIITSSLALSVLADLLPRLSHSQPVVRKKTIVTLYRLALVYPETLRVAWPKIKERLLDEQEDSSVTAATVNVVCELGWRRPKDFLSLAPRLFDLLIDGRNNWMAIKIIKLFAVLTPLEPRLVKKLVRPLTNLILSTTAMSLLYECINGVIQGGILDGAEGASERDEVASLCINKLRGMILLEGDPNLKYVALLAFNKIVSSHPQLVARQEDVILGCLDDPDISIRTQALELVSGMVSSDNLQQVVDRLMKQLASSPTAPPKDQSSTNSRRAIGIAESDATDLEETLVLDKRGSDAPPLPDDYRREVVQKILYMCTLNTYGNVTDFEWYIETLVLLVRLLPPAAASVSAAKPGIAGKVGAELLNVAVRVRELRSETTRAAENLILIRNKSSMLPTTECGRDEVLESVAWIIGEYASELSFPEDTLDSLIHESSFLLDAVTLSNYVHAAPKVFAQIVQQRSRNWDAAQKTMVSLLLARVINFMEKLATHPNLEVQERSVEYLELHRLLAEAVDAAQTESGDAPILLTSALPGLFAGMDLNPVAVGAQAKVPIPDDLDLETAINPKLVNILQQSQIGDSENDEHDESQKYYSVPESAAMVQPMPPAKYLEEGEEEAKSLSYQTPEDAAARAKMKADRRARNKDDPFYIPQEGDSSGQSTPYQQMLSKEIDGGFDVDSIPIVDLQIGELNSPSVLSRIYKPKKKTNLPLKKRFAVTADETIGSDDPSSASNSLPRSMETGVPPIRPKKNLLSVDSSNLESFSLETNEEADQLDIERREAEEAEMAAAMREVERLRLEMQRAAERIETAEGVDVEGTVVKKKKKRRKAKPVAETENHDAATDGEVVEGEVVKKKKKKKRLPGLEPAAQDVD